MNSKTQNNNGSTLGTIIWLIIVLLIAAGIVANFYFTAYPLSIRLIGWLLLAGVALFLALQTDAGKTAWNFIKAARMEMRKVVWPTRQETVQTTLVVVGMVVLMALMLWGIDTVLLWAIGTLTGQAG